MHRAAARACLVFSLLGALISTAEADAARFFFVDVYLDSADAELAAYQIEIAATSPSAQLVGVEGGDGTAFAAPPYYDPAALAGHRIILAAFSTGSDLPRGATRVARLHIRQTDSSPPGLVVHVEAAADHRGEPINVSARLVPQPGDQT
jgi:hypothetical protein